MALAFKLLFTYSNQLAIFSFIKVVVYDKIENDLESLPFNANCALLRVIYPLKRYEILPFVS